MSYNQQAESFSSSGRRYIPTSDEVARNISFPKNWSQFDQVYSDIADVTPTREAFRSSGLVNQLNSIAHFAPKTQAEIIRVVVRDMCNLPADADGLVRIRNGVYRWRFGCSRAVA